MGATVANALTSSYWAGAKPKDYKGQDLDRALKTYEGLAGKSNLKIPANLIPRVPQGKIGEIDGCIKDLNNAVTELQKGLTVLKQVATALQAVQGAAAKTSADLTKLSKGKDADQDAYQNAAANANSVGAAAGGSSALASLPGGGAESALGSCDPAIAGASNVRSANKHRQHA